MNKSIVWGSVCCALFLFSSCHSHGDSEDHADHDHAAEIDPHSSETEEKKEGESSTCSNEIIFSAEQARFAGLEVTELSPSEFRKVIKTSGQIESSQGDERTVSATTEGVVSFATLLTEGKSVGQGASLVLLRSGNLATGDPLQKAKVAFDLAQEELERVQKLYDRHLLTSGDLLAARQGYEEANLTYRSLADDHTGAGRSVVSPLAGYVKNVFVREGDYVTVGQPLLTVSRNNRLTLKARVPERYLAELPTLTSANFCTSYEDTAYQLDQLGGKKLSSGRALGEDSYASVSFEFNNRGNVIPGSFVEVYLLGTPRKEVLALPREAVTEEEGLYFAYLQVDSEGYVKREVHLGSDDGHRIEILSGLSAGDRVVTSGAYQLKLAAATNAIPAHSHSH